MDSKPSEELSMRHNDLFTNGGEMGELMRAFDWVSTPVGPVACWPPSLRAALGILLRSAYPMFLWWGPDLVQFYNDSYRPCLGNDKHPSALGQPGRECWAEIWPIIGPLVEGVLAGGASTWSEDQFIPITRNGYLEEVYWTFSYSAVLDEDGSVGGVLVVCSETTGRVRAERRLRMLEQIRGAAIEAQSIEAVATLAARHFAENAADLPFALLYFLTPDGSRLQLIESVGMSPGTPMSLPSFEVASLATQTSGDWEMGQVLETGLAIFLDDASIRFGPLPGGIWETPASSALVLPIAKLGQIRPIGVLVAGISPAQAFDSSYRQFLELVAATLAAALTNIRAYQEAQERALALAELDRAKTTFFSNISHEFRTPLTLSLGPLDTLLSDEQYPLLPEQRQQVEIIHRNTLRQIKLVNTLLDFARIEAGRAKAVYVPTDLAQLTAALASTFQSLAEHAGLQFLVEFAPLPENIYVDPDLWETIVLNLLSNAFKFTFEGCIRLALSPTETGVSLVVQDTGVGISAEDLPHLFERFYRAHTSQARTVEGSGIGLALVQELVRLHGGTIRVESTEQVGTTFTIHLLAGSSHLPADQLGTGQPLTTAGGHTTSYVEEAWRWLPEQSLLPTQPGEGARAALSQHDSQNASGTTRSAALVLVVDDNADMRAYLKHLLQPPYDVLLSSNGTSALLLAQEVSPDLIISDVMMPGLDGFALLKALRAEPLTAAIPVILLSARAGEEATLEGLQAGANDYLAKPFSAREVLARVRVQLEIARLSREAELARVHLHDLLMQAPASICVLRGPEHIYELSNPLYQQLTGNRELLGKPIREALPELAGQGIYELLDQVYTTGEAFHGKEIRADLQRGVDGALEECYFNFVYQPLRAATGEVEGIMVHAVDVSEQVQARQRLSSFLGIASHELRNPLTSIKGNVDLARRRVSKLLEQQIDAGNMRTELENVTLMLSRAMHQINFQNRLVSDLVDATRVQVGKLGLHLAPTDVFILVRETVEEQRRLAPARVIQLEGETASRRIINLDADRIVQVLTNYLSNALKYSEQEQEVIVRLEFCETEVRVTVQDKGPGLTREEQEHIWERFYRIPGIQVKSGTGIGLGLGLHICQSIIEQHGGRVGVESMKGAGSVFWFSLPYRIENESQQLSEGSIVPENAAGQALQSI